MTTKRKRAGEELEGESNDTGDRDFGGGMHDGGQSDHDEIDNDGGSNWGPRGRPTVTQQVRLLERAKSTGEAAGLLHALVGELDDDPSQRAEFIDAGGLSKLVQALEDFGFEMVDEGDDDELRALAEGITPDECAVWACALLHMATSADSQADYAMVEPWKLAAVEAGAALDGRTCTFAVLVSVLRAWPDESRVQNATMHAIDSLASGGTPEAMDRKLKALEAQALPAVLDGLRTHRGVLEVQEYGLGALARLVNLDEAHRTRLTDAGDEISVIAVTAASILPRKIAFDAGAIELAREALRLHASADVAVAAQAITVLTNLAMGPDDGAPARKAAARAAMLSEVHAALQAHPGDGHLHDVSASLVRNLTSTFGGDHFATTGPGDAAPSQLY